jgi:hypothetical protein
MKKTYQSPEALVIKIQINESLLITQSEGQVSGENGGWVKEEEDYNPISDKKIWNDEW